MPDRPPTPNFPPPASEATPDPARRQRLSNSVVIGAAAAVIAAVVITGIVIVQSRGDGEPNVSASASATGDVVTAAAEEPGPEPTETGPQIFGLSDTVTYETGVEVSLSKFTRATSSDYASPENTPYMKFTVKVKNGGSNTVDTTALMVNCSYSEDGQSSDSVFDDGLDGSPSTQLLAGRSLSVSWGCALPKGEDVLQVEVAPDLESETAIFTGNLK
ncbi:hypothetical protein ABTX35_08980 [Streptomyces sp. NPDC096080]|uniref:hypothetical protein n=1 Tax=Streptomyces sp. NPDC096080 TaxID=3156693 RepID=UPI003327BD20